jgi:hypothetical protein
MKGTITMSETEHLLEEIGREIESLVRKHNSASNEVCAVLAREAFDDAIDFAGIPCDTARDYFNRLFPTLNLYL